jgi:MFS family permease
MQAVESPTYWARLAVTTIFFVNGALTGNFVARIPAIKEALGLSPGELGAALLGLPVGLVVAVPFAGWLVSRFGSRPVTTFAGAFVCAALLLPALAPVAPLLFSALALLGAGLGALDVAMNVGGAAVEAAYRRPIMSSLHGLYSVGGLVGSAFGALMASLGIGTRTHFLAAALVLGTLALLASSRLPTEGAKDLESGPTFALPTRAVLGLGLVAFCVLLGEGAIADWSAVYLTGIGADPGLAAVGFGAFSSTMALGRLFGDAINRRLGPVALVRIGGAIATAGLLVFLSAGQPLVALVGLVLVGAGYSNVFPTTISAASRAPSMSSGSAIAAVTTLGYFALLAGPPLIGFLAEAVTLRGALGILVLLSALIVAWARAVLR